MSMRQLRTDARVAVVLALRELLKLRSERARVFGMVVQPLLIWWVFGFGFETGFGGGSGSASFQDYFFPGVVMMSVLFGCVFSSMTVIDDRQGGFLQSALVTPASRVAIVLGKSLGVTTLTFLQTALILLFAFFFHEGNWRVDLDQFLAWYGITCFALVPLNLAVAFWLNSTQSFHAFMGIVLLPAWALSGAVFPLREGLMQHIALLNPMSYMVDGFRSSFGFQLSSVSPMPLVVQLVVLVFLGVGGVSLSVLSLKKSAGSQ